MNSWKKIANDGHEEVSRFTTRSFSKHGLSKSFAREKRLRNRAAKKADARWHTSSQG